ncbi:restriction endonuclease [Sphingomonas sp. VDB2]|uniref:restriction endonuclease n=1 Tax=Sphingomonas sp. VDB2 TaxID=3228751 RepID=UPI003A805395|nr:hypothetical protein [Sphingobium sp.]
MISDDEYLERIVAGIHAVTTEDADVTWNETINGRQFDVVVRFTVGTLRYLVLVEVKNRTRKASVEDLDAFINKARDQLASKAVFVTAAGYQSGAIAVAERHGVDLFTVAFDEQELEISPTNTYLVMRNPNAPDIPEGTVPELKIGDLETILAVEQATLIYSNRTRWVMPNEPSQMQYYVEKTLFEDGTTLNEFLQSQRLSVPAPGKTLLDKIKIRPARRISPPDDYYFPQGKLSAIECMVASREGRGLSGNIRIDPSVFRHPVIYTNVQTGEAIHFSLDQLPLGAKRVEPGSFYFNLHPLRYFYCDSVEDELITWHLVESFQCGHMNRATFTQKIRYSAYYIPVTDKMIIKRLERRLSDYLTLSGGTRPANPSPVQPPRWRLPWLRSGQAGRPL